MSITCMDRRRRTGLLLQILLCWALIGLCCAGHRPRERGERTRHTRHHDRLSQRIHYPQLNDQGTQKIEYPSLNDQAIRWIRVPWLFGRGQATRPPAVNDSAASSQIQVKICEDVMRLLVGGILFCTAQRLRCGLLVTWRLLSLKAKFMLWFLSVNC